MGKHNFAYSFAWTQNSISDVKRRAPTEGVWEQGAEESIWTEEE
jgi:hypothetical protein